MRFICNKVIDHRWIWMIGAGARSHGLETYLWDFGPLVVMALTVLVGEVLARRRRG